MGEMQENKKMEEEGSLRVKQPKRSGSKRFCLLLAVQSRSGKEVHTVFHLAYSEREANCNRSNHTLSLLLSALFAPSSSLTLSLSLLSL
jgi:hypothetical protein